MSPGLKRPGSLLGLGWDGAVMISGPNVSCGVVVSGLADTLPRCCYSWHVVYTKGSTCREFSWHVGSGGKDRRNIPLSCEAVR
jgi:hypothetical protein